MHIDKNSKISFDPVSLMVDGKRWFPMMGEMHFSRCPKKYWEQELLKMKAGGIDIVSLYVIWIHHEEIQGEFDFTSDRCLRDFLETVKKCGLYSILRIGPWAHGEARNGGFPDWLLKDGEENGYEVRTDNTRYLEHVRAFYEKTYEQAKGLFIKDNGPVIGIQIENEYGHCGGKTGEEGEQHMKTLKAMALEIGFDAPLYTATGWGGAVTGGMVPVMGGYCEAPWDQRLTEIEPSGNYIFTRERNDHNIGSDYGLGVGITFDQDKFPFLTAELGGGLQVTHHRRPIATGLDTAAMTMTKIGCGANLLGYYMYHGGTNPKGKLTTLQETRETGYPNDLPAYSYDFNAPLREYGQMEDAYKEVRMIASFIHDFGDDLCDMPYTEQPGNPLKPGNLTDLRTSVRYKKRKDSKGNTYNSGYLFVNNYQRRYKMALHKDIAPTAYKEDGTELASFAKRDIADGDFFFYPFGMPIGDSALITIDATPMCIINDVDGKGHKAYVFYTDTDREVSFDIEGDAKGNKIIVLTRGEALASSKVVIGKKEHLVISEGMPVTGNDGKVQLYFDVAKGENKKPSFRVYPELKKEPANFTCSKKSDAGSTFTDGDAFAIYECKESFGNDAEASFEFENGKGIIKISGKMPHMNELFMHIAYAGDSAVIKKDGEIIADNFYTGQKWEVGLDRFMGANGCAAFEIDIKPLNKDDKIYLQDWPKMNANGDFANRLESIDLFAQYRINID
ncbi:beta-galactosidase [Butyrivibrio sp. INlla21]|uniref:beta-galactosidase n=1 Tax=Butyrivibrio sp. INlla21 TaxID=1520811 RepID=UPI0008E642C6|nr:beta-galactosidase [Butyrivibrio sp. INlla21]SFU31353.1 Glycosyl hydrolases family 35 [Butyrivibrio sp. INlla21]